MRCAIVLFLCMFNVLQTLIAVARIGLHCMTSIPWHPCRTFCRDKDPSLRSLSLKTFTGIIFQHCPGLAQLYKDRDAIYARFSAYKQTVPVMGAILLNVAMDKCLLVRGFKDSASWGFPKGKVAKEESDMACAIREVLLPPCCACSWLHIFLAGLAFMEHYYKADTCCYHVCMLPLGAAYGRPRLVTCTGAFLRLTGLTPILQVKEETGLDIGRVIVEEDCIERHIKQQRQQALHRHRGGQAQDPCASWAGS